MENWDDEKLNEVIKKKHGGDDDDAVQPQTTIVRPSICLSVRPSRLRVLLVLCG